MIYFALELKYKKQYWDINLWLQNWCVLVTFKAAAPSTIINHEHYNATETRAIMT